MNTFSILHGDAIEQIRTLPDKSVHCLVTSPPYWGLRDYGHAGQIGLEETPGEYVGRLVAVFTEVRRVLRDDGTCWVNLGDSYSGSGTIGRNDTGPEALRRRAEKYGTDTGNGSLVGNSGSRQPVDGLKPKDLVGIPWRVAFALQADGWWLRQDIIWHKPNPMPESVRDRCTKAHEYVFLLTKSARYFYDADAVSEAATVGFNGSSFISDYDRQTKPGLGMGERVELPTRNKRSVWSIATQPYAGAHFATMPPELAETCIRAGTSAKGCCPVCGAPWERVTERTASGKQNGDTNGKDGALRNDTAAWAGRVGEVQTTTIGWQPTCECAAADPIPCTVLDPFCGSGTTLAVAIANGRNGIGIELNAAYIELAMDRITGTQPALLGV